MKQFEDCILWKWNDASWVPLLNIPAFFLVDILAYIICHYDPLAPVDELLLERLGIVPAQAGAVVGVGHRVASIWVNVALH